MEILALILFLCIFLFILFGYPVAFTLGGISAIVGYFALGPTFFNFLPSRIMGVMSNYVLMAVPLFVYMGIMLEKSGLAAGLLDTMAMLFGRVKGGLAISVMLVGALLAASTGIVGATVITMGLISLPTMLKRNYKPELAAGTVASAGTLGQIIPPSVVLVLLGSVLNVSVGELFKAALLPGIMLVGAYVIYILIAAKLNPEIAPAIPKEEIDAFKSENLIQKVIMAFLLPLLLIIAVLGSIFAGLASPTEAAAIGAVGATLLTIVQGKFSMTILKEVMRGTTFLTSMVFLILLGATTFALVFRGLGGDTYLIDLIHAAQMSPTVFLLIVMLVVFIAGFFIDFIEIIFIIVPVVAPIFANYGMDLIWIGVLLALNLQSSFLSPPFGFSLFYLKGVAPPQITTAHIYRGIVPFLLIQLVFLALVLFVPKLVFLF
jgi:tripartite ATP-independent transporter DctM subunit